MWTTSVIFKMPVKVNNHPMGENSPNLVTLHRSIPGGRCYNHCSLFLVIRITFRQKVSMFLTRNYLIIKQKIAVPNSVKIFSKS
jgi:hypothetical protein